MRRRVSCLRVLRWDVTLWRRKIVATGRFAIRVLSSIRFRAEVFLDKIRLSLTGRYRDNIDQFLQSDSYSDLLETILAF